MEILHRSDKCITLSVGNKTYHYTNIGEYVGASSRKHYDPAPDYWKLTSYEEDRVEGKLKIDTLQDSAGNYTLIELSQNGIFRILQLCCGHVLTDIMHDHRTPNAIQYAAYETDNKNKQPIELEAYFSIVRTHESVDGHVLGTGHLNNAIIKEFIDTDKRLLPIVTDANRKRIRTKNVEDK